LFRARGIDLDEPQALSLIEEALAAAPDARPAPSPLTSDEAALYDQSGMAEDEAALQVLAGDTAARYAALMASALPVAEAARRTGVSRSRMQQMVSSGAVWAIRRAGRWVLPQMQFEGAALLPGWSEVARALPREAHPLEVLGFLTTAQPELTIDRKPLTVCEWLRGGGSPSVAASLAEGLSAMAA
jgi:hypothetical protein